MIRSVSLRVHMRESRCLLGLLLGLAAVSGPAAAPATVRAIYRCSVEGVLTFADAPCGADAQVHAIDTSRISTYAPVATPNRQSAAARTKEQRAPVRKTGSIAADQARHAAQCAKLDASLRDLRSKMRAGYDVKQGERLRERQGKLAASRRAAECR